MPRNAHVPPRIAPRAQIAASLQREMKSNVTAEAFAEQHGPALLQWLQTNTVECACTTPFGPDENLQRGTIDLTTSLACRRCYVPLLHLLLTARLLRTVSLVVPEYHNSSHAVPK